jgi:hypothetical protein
MSQVMSPVASRPILPVCQMHWSSPGAIMIWLNTADDGQVFHAPGVPLSHQIARLKSVRASRDSVKVEAALGKLRESATVKESTSKGSHPLNLLKLAVEAARLRATLGEISGRSTGAERVTKVLAL